MLPKKDSDAYYYSLIIAKRQTSKVLTMNCQDKQSSQPSQVQPFNNEDGLTFKNHPTEKEKHQYSKIRFTRATLTSVQSECSRKIRIFSQLLDQLLGLLRSSKPHLHKLLHSIFCNTKLATDQNIRQLGDVFFSGGKSIAMHKLINLLVRGASSSQRLIQQLNRFIANTQQLIIEKNKSENQIVRKNLIQQHAKVCCRRHKLPSFLIEHRLSFQRRESLDLLKEVDRIEKCYGGLKFLKKLRREQKLDLDRLSFNLNARLQTEL